MQEFKKLSGQQIIRDRARSIIAANPGGIRYSVLVDAICQEAPQTPENSVEASVWNLDALFPNEIAKPSRGVFAPIKRSGNEEVSVGDTDPNAIGSAKVEEAGFYEPFAQWLQNDLDEVTFAAPLGGACLKSKWGTPDVVGIYKPLARDLVKFPVEIVSAEIKIDRQAPVVAFGQAVAYRLFSTKTYIVMPKTLTPEDQARLESLCMLFGVGLVLFDLNVTAPDFAIRVRAQRFLPDMFYVNEFAERLKRHDAEIFESLFG
ncbi:MAG: hypothetical protein WBQ65_26835 [Bryobacteraceae bacterium]